MIRSALAVALCAAACGEVAQQIPADGAIDAPPSDAATVKTYRGSADQLPPSMFGGSPYCSYTITLKQLAIELGILPSGQVTTGHVQDLNVEAVIPSMIPLCPPDYEVIAPNIASYTFQSSKPSASGMTLTFQGADSNGPHADLTIDLTSVGTAFQARLGFHRNDVDPPLDWSIITTVSLSAQLSATPRS